MPSSASPASSASGSPVHGTGRRSGVGCLLIATIVAVLLVAGLVVAVRHFEDERRDRIEHAEDKYGLTYVRRVKNGEGGGQWRTSEGTTLTCTITGDVADPVLDCGDGEPSEHP